MNNGIYIIENKINGNRYVGSAVNIRDRWAGHRSDLGKGEHHSRYLQRAWNKYGKDAFEFRVLLYCDPIKETMVEIFEQRLIDQKSEYNMCKIAGSSLGIKRTAEYITQMSARMKDRKLSKEHKANIGAAHRGSKRSKEARVNMSKAQSGRKCKPFTEEHKAKISAANKGRVLSDEHKAKLSAAQKGKKLSDEHKAKIGMIKKGNQYLLGYKHTAEAKEKIGLAQRGRKKSEEHRLKIIASLAEARKKRWTPEARAHYSETRMGHEVSEETRAQISASLKGKPWSPARRAAQEARCSS